VTDTVQRAVKATEMDAFGQEQRRIISELRAAHEKYRAKSPATLSLKRNRYHDRYVIGGLRPAARLLEY
jgi:hypothetical protein